MRRRVVQVLSHLDAVAVENAARPGTPDVNYVEGWLELKQAPRWPRDGVLKFRHFTPQQRVWLRARSEAGGNVHMLIQVAQEWILIEGAVAAAMVGYAGRVELYQAAERVWDSTASMAEDLALELSGGR